MAQASFEYSRSGTLPDQSRYSYTYSASVWQPTPKDLDLDKAIEQFASLDVGAPPLATSSHRYGNSSRYDRSRISSSRVQDPTFPGSYSGRYSTASSASSRRPDREAIVHPRTIAAPPPLASDLDRETARPSRRSQNACYTSAPLNEDKALVRCGGRELGTDDMSLAPEDSVSQVSRPRPRRREGSVVSGQTIRFGEKTGERSEPEVSEVDEHGEPSCLTRDVTP